MELLGLFLECDFFKSSLPIFPDFKTQRPDFGFKILSLSQCFEFIYI